MSLCLQNELKEAGQGRVELSAQLAEVVTERQVTSGLLFFTPFDAKCLQLNLVYFTINDLHNDVQDLNVTAQ